MKTKRFLLLSVLFLSVSSAHAVDHFALGTDAYSKNDFAKAKTEYELAIKSDPTNWQAQYQLANSLLELKDFSGAEVAYKACLLMKPTSEISRNCHDAIAFLGKPRTTLKPVLPQNGTSTSANVPSSVSTTSAPTASVRPIEEIRPTPIASPSLPVGSSGASAVPGSVLDEGRAAAIEAHKKNIRADEVRQVAALKAEEEDAIQAGNAASWHHWTNSITGQHYTAMTTDEKNALMKEYDDRIQKVHDETERRLKECTTP